MSSENDQTWEEFKLAHPRGSKVVGRVTHVAAYGVYVNLGVPFAALLLVPYIAPIGKSKSYPGDYPKIGDEITAFVRHFGDDIASNGRGKIALTQDPHEVERASGSS